MSIRSGSNSRHLVSGVDQGLSSFSNLLAIVALARALPFEEFGIFSLLWAGLTLFLGASRAYFGIPISLSAREGLISTSKAYSVAFSGILVLTIPIVAILLGLGALAAGGSSSELTIVIVWAVSIATPIVLMQDLMRYCAIAQDRPQFAIFSDGVWFVGSIILIVVGTSLAPEVLIGAWLSIIALSLVVAMIWYLPTVNIVSGFRNLMPMRGGVRESVFGTALLSNGTGLLVAVLITPFFGLAGVGSLRGAGTLFGPINTLITFLDFAVLSVLSTRPRSKDYGALAKLLAFVIFVSVLWGGLLLLLPQDIGEAILGSTWTGARALVPVVLVEYTFLGAVAAMSLVLKVRGQALALLWNKVLSSAAILLGVVFAVLLADELIWVSGALAAGAFVGMIAMARSIRRTLKSE